MNYINYNNNYIIDKGSTKGNFATRKFNKINI